MNPQSLINQFGDSSPVLAPMIVAEVTKNWTAGETPTTPILCQLFEEIIGHNNARGYRLMDWKMTSHYKPSVCLGEGKQHEPACMTETIVAVFEKV